MKQYTVTGMNCAACSARVEKAVLKVEGVTSCSVSLLTNSMAVEGTASPASIIKAVKDAGYGAKEKGNEAEKRSNEAEDALEDHETPKLKETGSIGHFFADPHVFFHGTYDVELENSGVVWRKSCGNGIAAVTLSRNHHGHQPEIFYQRFSGTIAQISEYGHLSCIRSIRFLSVECLCIVCDDKGTDGWRYGCCHALHGRVLF